MSGLTKKGKPRVNADPGLLCFTHCDNKAIYCLEIPAKCPICEQPLRGLGSQLEPYKVEYPFVRAEQTACALVIKPAKGNFMRDYQLNSDLHIAATTSSGMVVEFDKDGVTRGYSEEWNQCLAVKKMEYDLWFRRWDQTLLHSASNNKFNEKSYHAKNYNCFTFIMEFLRSLRSGEFRWMYPNKENFCDKYVKKPLAEACRYVHLYRNVKHKGYFYYDEPL